MKVFLEYYVHCLLSLWGVQFFECSWGVQSVFGVFSLLEMTLCILALQLYEHRFMSPSEK